MWVEDLQKQLENQQANGGSPPEMQTNELPQKLSNADIPGFSSPREVLNTENESHIHRTQDQNSGTASTPSLSDVQTWLTAPVDCKFPITGLESWDCVGDSFQGLTDAVLNDYTQTLQPGMETKLQITPMVHNDL
jgi:hypothetical protein